MISPTVGRVVWFWPEGQRPGVQPLAASVAYVHSDRCINIGYLDANGQHENATSVKLAQDDDVVPDEKRYCTWMPYQVGQAKKTEDLQAAAEKGFRDGNR